jgi:hypothetical protein
VVLMAGTCVAVSAAIWAVLKAFQSSVVNREIDKVDKAAIWAVDRAVIKEAIWVLQQAQKLHGADAPLDKGFPLLSVLSEHLLQDLSGPGSA